MQSFATLRLSGSFLGSAEARNKSKSEEKHARVWNAFFRVGKGQEAHG